MKTKYHDNTEPQKGCRNEQNNIRETTKKKKLLINLKNLSANKARVLLYLHNMSPLSISK